MRRISMPPTVKVTTHTYRVVRKSRADMPVIDGEDSNAYVDQDALEMGFVKGAPLAKTQERLVHESLHPMWPAGYGFEEEIITHLAKQILAWIRDNPEMVKFLTQS